MTGNENASAGQQAPAVPPAPLMHPLEVMVRSRGIYRPLTALQVAGGVLLAATAASAFPLAAGCAVAAQGAYRLSAGRRSRAPLEEGVADRLSRKSPALAGTLKMGVGALKMAAAFMLYSVPLTVPLLGFVPAALAAVTALAGASSLADGIETVWPTPPNPLADAMRQMAEEQQHPAPVPDSEPPAPAAPSVRNVNGTFNGRVAAEGLPMPVPPPLPARLTPPGGPAVPEV